MPCLPNIQKKRATSLSTSSPEPMDMGTRTGQSGASAQTAAWIGMKRSKVGNAQWHPGEMLCKSISYRWKHSIMQSPLQSWPLSLPWLLPRVPFCFCPLSGLLAFSSSQYSAVCSWESHGTLRGSHIVVYLTDPISPLNVHLPITMVYILEYRGITLAWWE